MSESSEMIDKLVQVALDDYMKSEGYIKRNRAYYLDGREIIKILQILSSNYNYKGFGKICLFVGTYVPSIEKLLKGKVIKYPKLFDCTIYAIQGQWHNFGPEIDINKFADNLRRDFLNNFKPWLDRFQTADDVKDYCIENNDTLHSAVIYVMSGEMEKAREQMKIYLELFKSESFDADAKCRKYKNMVYEWVRNLGLSDLVEE